MSDDHIPEPGDDDYDEWLEDLLGCENCGGTNFRDEELRSGPNAGSLVEICADCGYPHLHNHPYYSDGGDEE